MRILFFDTESTDLKAMMGRLLCCSFKTLDGEPYTFRADQKPHSGKTKIDDLRLAVAVRNELEVAHMIVGWNSKLHDIPLLNARLIKGGERPFRPHLHLDLMWYARGGSAKIGSAKLDNVSKYLNVPSRKTPLDWETWQLAGAGDKAAMDQVVEHCEADTVVTAEVYPYLLPLVKNIHR